LGEEGVVDGGEGAFEGLGGGVGLGDELDGDGEGAVAGAIAGLIEGEEEAAGGEHAHFELGADEEGAGGGVGADAGDDGAAAGVVEGEGADEVAPAAGDALGGSRLHGVGVFHAAGGGKTVEIARVDVKAGIDPAGGGGEIERFGGGLGEQGESGKQRKCGAHGRGSSSATSLA